jgi:predicted transcriptional regulator
MDQPSPIETPSALTYVASIVSAYVSNNPLAATDLAALIRDVHNTLQNISSNSPGEMGATKPAVAIRKSVTPGYIVCLEDGKKLKMLKRYLRSRYDMTPEAYRAKWNLPHDYPMVAPNYASLRSAFAKKIGLGKRTERPKIRAKKR